MRCSQLQLQLQCPVRIEIPKGLFLAQLRETFDCFVTRAAGNGKPKFEQRQLHAQCVLNGCRSSSRALDERDEIPE
jgi:hypothetical protein